MGLKGEEKEWNNPFTSLDSSPEGMSKVREYKEILVSEDHVVNIVDKFHKDLLNKDVPDGPTSKGTAKPKSLKKDNVSSQEVVEIINEMWEEQKIASYEPITISGDVATEVIEQKYQHLESIFKKTGKIDDQMEWEAITAKAAIDVKKAAAAKVDPAINIDMDCYIKAIAIRMAQQNVLVQAHNELNAVFEKRLKAADRAKENINDNDKRTNSSPEKKEERAKKFVKGD